MLIRIVTSILLFVALTRLPIGYFKFLRWVVCVAALYSAYVSYYKNEKINFGVWLFCLVALLFNPLIPFYLDKSSWQIIDLATGIIFIFSTFFVSEKNE